jgi:hypothetical protein
MPKRTKFTATDDNWAAQLQQSNDAAIEATREARVNYLAAAFGRPISEHTRAALYVLDRHGDLAVVEALRAEIAALAAAVPPRYQPQAGDWVRLEGRPGLWQVREIVKGRRDDRFVWLARLVDHRTALSGYSPVTVPLTEIRPTAATVAERALGERQRRVLACLRAAPWPGFGWTYDNVSTAKRIIAGLVKRGLAERHPDFNREVWRATDPDESPARVHPDQYHRDSDDNGEI